jgi:hypothetical protein
MSESRKIIGRWRITEMDNWDQEAVDLVQPGFIEFDKDGLGGLGFIVVTGELDCRDADRDGIYFHLGDDSAFRAERLNGVVR